MEGDAMGWKFYSAIFLALTSSAGSACAQLAPEWKFCDSKGLGTSDERIRSCTVLAESSRESAKNKAVAYFNRGIAWYLKGDNDRAIGDYSDAIRLNPMYASAYNNRCYVRTIIGQVDSALADCDESLR